MMSSSKQLLLNLMYWSISLTIARHVRNFNPSLSNYNMTFRKRLLSRRIR